jgi:hypothetical protein
MAQKQGGKGKSSSQSDLNYWNRLKLSGGRSKRKLRNLKNAGKLAGSVPDYGRKPAKGKSPERVVFSGQTAKQSGAFLHIIRCNGVILEISPRLSDVIFSRDRIAPKLDYTHGILNPLTGRVLPIASRNAN